jgi:hypothetical protein
LGIEKAIWYYDGYSPELPSSNRHALVADGDGKFAINSAEVGSSLPVQRGKSLKGAGGFWEGEKRSRKKLEEKMFAVDAIGRMSPVRVVLLR